MQHIARIARAKKLGVTLSAGVSKNPLSIIALLQVKPRIRVMTSISNRATISFKMTKNPRLPQ